MNPTLRRIISIVLTIIVPFFLVMTAIRILFTPLFFQIEYRAPGFPADTYGFNLEDRLHWSRVSLEYLLTNEGISYLADQRLPGGEPLYNERELSHMLDVKKLVKQMITAWWFLLIALVGLGIWAWRGRWLADFTRALSTGGMLTLGMIAIILVAVILSFSSLFTAFHRLFFTGDTWLFYYSDSLIRLFPLRFWQDGFIMMGVFTILGALALMFIYSRWGKRLA